MADSTCQAIVASCAFSRAPSRVAVHCNQDYTLAKSRAESAISYETAIFDSVRTRLEESRPLADCSCDPDLQRG